MKNWIGIALSHKKNSYIPWQLIIDFNMTYLKKKKNKAFIIAVECTYFFWEIKSTQLWMMI